MDAVTRDLGGVRTGGSRLLAGIATATTLALLLGGMPGAHADDQIETLKAQRSTVRSAIGDSASNLDVFSDALNAAAQALSASETRLADARASLASAQSARDAAQREDQRLAGELARARQRVADAKAAVRQGLAELAAEKQLIGQAARRTQQQQTPLLGVAAFVNSIGTGDLAQRSQWSVQIFNATQNQMDRLQTAQIRLEAAEQEVVAAEKATRDLKARAEAHLGRTTMAEIAAADAQQQVATLVTANQRARTSAATQLKLEQQRNAELVAEQNAVEQRIRSRVAKVKADAAQREAARQEALRLQAVKDAQRAVARANQAARDKAAAARTGQTAPRSGTGSTGSTTPRAVAPVQSTAPAVPFSRPLSGPITSGYGMRFHPVLHVWKLHDGTDFGGLRDADQGPARRSGRGALLQRWLRQPADDRPRAGRRLLPDHRLQPRQLLRGLTRPVGQPGTDHRLRRQHRLLDRLPPSPDGVGGRLGGQPDPVVLTRHPGESHLLSSRSPCTVVGWVA